MEELKVNFTQDSMIIEGEFDLELDLNTIHFGCPPEDEDLFNRTAFEIRSYGEINLKYLKDLVQWLNIKSISRTPQEWPRWRLTIERLYEGVDDSKNKDKNTNDDKNVPSRHANAMEDFKKMGFI